MPLLLENEKDGSLLVLVPGGMFLAGGKGSDEGKGPPFEVELSPFYIGMTCVTNEQYAKFVRETNHRAPGMSSAYHRASVWESGSYPAEKVDHPVVCVDWQDARAYCAWAGLRLPGELEWEKAARGVDGRDYPWGDRWDESKYRNDKNRGSETTAGVWGYAREASLWGVVQTIGNVWEWCEDGFEEKAYDRYKRGDLSVRKETTRRVVRGGSWFNLSTGGFQCMFRTSYSPDLCYDDLGFRVARSVL